VEKSRTVLDQAIRERLCALAHDLNNAMTVVAGHCELILEHAEPGSECEKRLRQILMIAHTVAKRINGHECRMASPLEQDTLDPNVPLSSIQNSAKPGQSTNPAAGKSAKLG